MKRRLILTGPTARAAACREVMAAPEGYAVTIGESTRTLDQNAALWPILDALSNNLIWYGHKLSKEGVFSE